MSKVLQVVLEHEHEHVTWWDFLSASKEVVYSAVIHLSRQNPHLFPIFFFTLDVVKLLQEHLQISYPRGTMFAIVRKFEKPDYERRYSHQAFRLSLYLFKYFGASSPNMQYLWHPMTIIPFLRAGFARSVCPVIRQHRELIHDLTSVIPKHRHSGPPSFARRTQTIDASILLSLLCASRQLQLTL